MPKNERKNGMAQSTCRCLMVGWKALPLYSLISVCTPLSGTRATYNEKDEKIEFETSYS